MEKEKRSLSLSLLLILTQIYLCAILFDFFALNALRCRLDVCMYEFKSTTFFCRHRCRSGERYRLRFWFLWLFHCSVTWSCKVHTHMILSSRSLQHRTMWHNKDVKWVSNNLSLLMTLAFIQSFQFRCAFFHPSGSRTKQIQENSVLCLFSFFSFIFNLYQCLFQMGRFSWLQQKVFDINVKLLHMPNWVWFFFCLY